MLMLVSVQRKTISAEGINLLWSSVWGKTTGNVASDITGGTFKVVRTTV